MFLARSEAESSVCRSVLGWRKWYHKQGGGGFWEASGRDPTPAPVLTREQLLDRYHQHTQNCPACSKVSSAAFRLALASAAAAGYARERPTARVQAAMVLTH